MINQLYIEKNIIGTPSFCSITYILRYFIYKKNCHIVTFHNNIFSSLQGIRMKLRVYATNQTQREN